MYFSTISLAAILATGAYSAAIDGIDNSSGGLTLSADAVQKGSESSGVGDIGSEAGQALSAVSTNNFINVCAGKTLTNGLQITGGSCNGIPMGDIPAKTKMASSVIINPPTGGKAIQAGVTFNITVQVANMLLGSFTDADTTYYNGPQFLSGGIPVGHTHVTVQDMGSSLNPQQALDATQFAFFKGINDAGNGQGLLNAVVTDGLPAGNYRVCTMTSASNHQPVVMPVAQRGTADDCTKFTVEGAGGAANAASNSGSAGDAAAANAASAVSAGVGNEALATGAATSVAAAASTTAAAIGGKGAGNAAGNAGSAASTGTANTGGKGGFAAGGAKAGAGGKGGQAGQGAAGKGGRLRRARARREYLA